MTGKEIGEPTQAQNAHESNQMFMDMMKSMGIIDKDDDLIEDYDGLRVRLYKAGEYVSEKGFTFGEKKKYEAGIELKQGTMKIMVSATQLLMMVKGLPNSKEIRDELRVRVKAEQALMAGLTSW